MQEVRRFKPSTISRRFSVLAGFYRTAVIDGVLDHSPAEHVRRPAVPPESPTLGFTHLPFEAADLGGSGAAMSCARGPLVTGDSVAASHRAQPVPVCSVRGSRDSKRGGRGRTGDLGPRRPGPTPAEPARASANVKIAQGKGNPEGNRRRTGTGQRPKGTNRRMPDEGKPEEGGRTGENPAGKRETGGKPAGNPEVVR